MKDPWCNDLALSTSNMKVVSSNPGQATSFSIFFSTKMITFVPCNIFERIWYSEFILEWRLKSGFWSSILYTYIEKKCTKTNEFRPI